MFYQEGIQQLFDAIEFGGTPDESPRALGNKGFTQRDFFNTSNQYMGEVAELNLKTLTFIDITGQASLPLTTYKWQNGQASNFEMGATVFGAVTAPLSFGSGGSVRQLPRAPIFADTSLLINAAEKGSGSALREIRAGTTFITPNQYREFLNVTTSAQRTSRLSFLQGEGIKLFSGPQAGSIAQTSVFQNTFRATLLHGRGDASLAAFSRATGFSAVTSERRFFNFLTQSNPQLGVPIRRVP
jgi:hypothetical protein